MALAEVQMLVIRNSADLLLASYLSTPAVQGDARFKHIAPEYTPGSGTSCGFLCHWLMWRLGFLDTKIINRKVAASTPPLPLLPAPKFTYSTGKNISKIASGKTNANVVGLKSYVPGTVPLTGDIVFISQTAALNNVQKTAAHTPAKLAAAKTSLIAGGITSPSQAQITARAEQMLMFLTEHVFVFRRLSNPNDKTIWQTAEAGQTNTAGKQFATLKSRTVKATGKTNATNSAWPERNVRGWIPLSNLTPNAIIPLSPFPIVPQFPILLPPFDPILNGA